MMRSMRAKGNRSFAMILVGLLILGLAGFGIGGLGGGRINTVASVGEVPVTVDSYARMLNQRLQQLGRGVSIAEAEDIGVFRDVLRVSLNTAAVSNEAARFGISIGDEFVRESLVGIAGFQGIDGNFDRDAYEFAIDRAGMTTVEFENDLRDELRRAIIQNSVALGVKSSDALAVAIMSHELEERDVEWARLSPSNLDSPVEEPSDAQIEEHYTANSDDHMSPLTRSLSYAWLLPDMLIDEVDISEEELLEVYEGEPGRFNVPEMRAIERVVFESDEIASEARSRLDSGVASFDDIIAERGIEPGDAYLGMVDRDELSAEAAEAVFSLEQPGIAGPAESVFGPALFRIGSIQNAVNTPFDEVREDIRVELAEDLARSLVSERVTGIDDLLASGATIEEIIAETDLEGGIVDLSEDPATHVGIAAEREFRDAAWALAQGDFPEILDLSNGGIFMVRLDSVTEPEQLPLADVRNDVIEDWKRQVTMERLTEVADRIRSSLAVGDTLEDSEHGLEVTTENGITRRALIEGAPRQLTDELFSLASGETATVTADDDVYLVHLLEIRIPDEDVQEAVASYGQQNDQLRGSDMFQLYMSAVESAAGVSINQAAINQINTQLVIGGDG